LSHDAILNLSLSRKQISQCLEEILQHQLQIYGPFKSAWLYTLPYYHFLSGVCEPFHKLQPDDAWKVMEEKHWKLKKASGAEITAEYVTAASAGLYHVIEMQINGSVVDSILDLYTCVFGRMKGTSQILC